jgi:uroporphyrinogen-III decarboxylase
LKHPKGIRDIPEWYMSTLTRQDLLHQIFEEQVEYALANLEKIHAAVGDVFDAVFLCGTDFGTQNSSFCSPETYDSLWHPYYKAMTDWIHAHTAWKIMKHSCGAVENFMEHFIESGFDIINPVQCSATGMDPRNLKDRYGDRLVFWGGGVDTQKTLPFGAPKEVRQQTLERCGIFGANGGFVFNTVHNIQANTPIENMAAMFDAVREFNGS